MVTILQEKLVIKPLWTISANFMSVYSGRGLLYLFFSNIYIKATAIVVLPVLTRLLSVEQFGVYVLASTVLGYILVFVSNGFKRYLMVRKNLQRGVDYEFTIRYFHLLIGFLLSLVIGLMAFNAANFLLYSLIVSSVLIYGYHRAWLNELTGDMVLTSKSLIVERTVFFCIVVFAWWSKISILVFAAVPLSILAGALYARNSLIKPSLIFKFKIINFCIVSKGVFVYGFAFLISSINLTVDQVLIGVIGSDVDLGFYGGVSRLVFVFLTFIWMFNQAVSPGLAKIAGNAAMVSSFILRSTGVFVLIGVGIYFSVNYFSDQLVLLILGPLYSDGGPLLRLISLMLPIAILNTVWCDSLDLYGLAKHRLYIAAVALVLNIPLSYFLYYEHGLLGVAFSTVILQALVLLTAVWLVAIKFKLYLAGCIVAIYAFIIIFIAFGYVYY